MTLVSSEPDGEIVSYEILDDDGSVLAGGTAILDDGWWFAFQPMIRRQG